MTSINHYGQSFVGRRKNNQDSFCIHKLSDESYFLAVADGMGGMQGGEIASALCIRTSIDYLTEVFRQEVSIDELDKILRELNLRCQEAIRNEARNNPGLQGMGTTLTTVLIHHGHYACSNIGDSRIYLLENDQIIQLSKDHTYVQEYADEHGYKIPDLIIRQYSHILTRCIDGGDYPPDIFPEPASRRLGDHLIFMLCSDGLIMDKLFTNVHLLKNYLAGTAELEQAAHNLISQAFYAGSSDNITMVLFEIGDYPRKDIKLKQFPYPPVDTFNPYEVTTEKQKRVKRKKREWWKIWKKKAGKKEKVRKKRTWKIHHFIELFIALALLLFAILMLLSHFDIIDLKFLTG